MNYKIVYNNRNLKPFQKPEPIHGEYSARQLLRIAQDALSGVQIWADKEYECEFKDGRKQWMVSAFKYFRLKKLNEGKDDRIQLLESQIEALTGINKGK